MMCGSAGGAHQFTGYVEQQHLKGSGLSLVTLMLLSGSM